MGSETGGLLNLECGGKVRSELASAGRRHRFFVALGLIPRTGEKRCPYFALRLLRRAGCRLVPQHLRLVPRHGAGPARLCHRTCMFVLWYKRFVLSTGVEKIRPVGGHPLVGGASEAVTALGSLNPLWSSAHSCPSRDSSNSCKSQRPIGPELVSQVGVYDE